MMETGTNLSDQNQNQAYKTKTNKMCSQVKTKLTALWHVGSIKT